MKVFFSILALAIASSAFAQTPHDATHGKKLHDDKCLNCHGTEVYSREDRRVKTLNALANQVNNCMKGPAQADWTVTQTNAVIDYLNVKFYKF